MFGAGTRYASEDTLQIRCPIVNFKEFVSKSKQNWCYLFVYLTSLFYERPDEDSRNTIPCSVVVKVNINLLGITVDSNLLGM